MIIGFSGKKQAGKDTAADTIVEHLQAKYYGYYHQPFVLKTAFANALKDLVVDILGVPYEFCYGTDEQKNMLTHLRWDDQFVEIREKYAPIPTDSIPVPQMYDRRSGHMTGREVLQVIGTDWFRRVYPNVWVDYPFRKLANSTIDILLITDVRFPNECQRIIDEGGVVIRINRPGLKFNDRHPSETALDDYKFDIVIQNDGSLEDYKATVLEIFNEIRK